MTTSQLYSPKQSGSRNLEKELSGEKVSPAERFAQHRTVVKRQETGETEERQRRTKRGGRRVKGRLRGSRREGGFGRRSRDAPVDVTEAGMLRAMLKVKSRIMGAGEL